MMEQPEFVGSYRGCEIFAKAVSGGTQYIAIRAGGHEEVARKSTLVAAMAAIDGAREEEGENGRVG